LNASSRPETRWRGKSDALASAPRSPSGCARSEEAAEGAVAEEEAAVAEEAVAGRLTRAAVEEAAEAEAVEEAEAGQRDRGAHAG
jgi:hypothetical protein